MRLWLPLVIDLIAVAVFAVAGRASHGEALTATGVLTVAWPFWCGCLVGWAVTVPTRRFALSPQRWSDPSELPTGLVIWPVTFAAGMALRAIAGQGTAWPFLIVAFVALGVLLLGWRLVRRGIRSHRLSRADAG